MQGMPRAAVDRKKCCFVPVTLQTVVTSCVQLTLLFRLMRKVVFCCHSCLVAAVQYWSSSMLFLLLLELLLELLLMSNGVLILVLLMLTSLSLLFCASVQVIELEPKNERNFYKRFRVFLSKRKYAEAILDLSRALQLKPKYKQVGLA